MLVVAWKSAALAQAPLRQLLQPPGFVAWGGELIDAGDVDGNGFHDLGVLAGDKPDAPPCRCASGVSPWALFLVLLPLRRRNRR
ncbi:MAG: hypothetical protein FJ090_04420 [Deltaproteobacteria bacterium]|nr:hypothetical protein [Deltaproteobacteria bacterium]